MKKCVPFIVVVLFFSFTVVVQAQSSTDAPTENKKKEKVEKKKPNRKKVKVFTQKDLEELRKRYGLEPPKPVSENTQPAKEASEQNRKKRTPEISPEIMELEREKKLKEKQLAKLEKKLQNVKQQMNSSNALYMSVSFGDLVEKKERLEKEVAKLKKEIDEIKKKIEEAKREEEALETLQ